MTPLKRLLVSAMSTVCLGIDRTSGFLWWHWYLRPFYYLLWPLWRAGCPNGLAAWSCALDERWGTGVWQPPDGPSRQSIEPGSG